MKSRFKAMVCIVAAIAVIAGIYTVKSVKVVEQGEVGVVYSAKDGIQNETLSPGWHFVGPLHKVKTFPVSQQQLVLSSNPEDYNEKKHADWHVDAPANGGMVSLNMTVNYNFIADRVVDLYKKFNGKDGEAIVEEMVQNSIIAYVKEVTPKFSVMEIYSTKRSDVSRAITEYLDERLEPEYGINISSALIIDTQLDKELKKKVQAKEQAKQDAEKAELDKQTAIAQAETDKVKAEAEAAVAVAKAKGEAEANRLKSESVTKELIDMTEAEARLKHGWVTVQGASTVVKDK